MYNSFEEYMRNVLGYKNNDLCCGNNFQPNNMQTNSLNIMEPTMNNIDLYPEIYIKVNPLVISRCKSVTSRPTNELVSQIVDEIYLQVAPTTEVANRVTTNELNKGRRRNDFLRDLIRILVLNQLLNNRRPGYPHMMQPREKTYLQF